MVHEFRASFAHIFEISAQRQILDEIISLRDKQQSPPATTFLSVCTQNPAHRETRLCTYIYIYMYTNTHRVQHERLCRKTSHCNIRARLGRRRQQSLLTLERTQPRLSLRLCFAQSLEGERRRCNAISELPRAH